MLTETAVLLLACVALWHTQQLRALSSIEKKRQRAAEEVARLFDRMSENHAIGGSRKAELEQTPYGEAE